MRAALDQPFVAIGVERGEAGGARQRRAAKRAAVRARVEHVADRLRVGERAHREAAAEALGQAHDVGFEAGVLDGKPRPVRPKPVWISSTISSAPRSRQSRCGRLQEFRRADVDAALALHDLEDHGRRLIA